MTDALVVFTLLAIGSLSKLATVDFAWASMVWVGLLVAVFTRWPTE